MNDAYANWSARGRAPTANEAALRRALADADRRRDAALALVDRADEGLETATTEALAETVRTAPTPETRQFAVEALGVAETGVDAIDAALADDDEWVRAEAVVALSRAGPASADRLRDCLASDDSGWVRRNAVIALGKRGALDDETAIERLTEDPHPAVREFAAQFLRTPADTDRAVRLLAAVLAREQNAYVRVKAAETLGHLGTDRAIEALETQGLGDRSDDVRRTAERALNRAKGIDEPVANGDRPAPGTSPDRPGGERASAPGRSAPGPGPGFEPSGRGPGGPRPAGRPVGDRDAGSGGGDRQ